jgi:hypothetical protein
MGQYGCVTKSQEVTMSNKQSSILWLYSKMYEHRGIITIEEFEQAKAMHKEEIINSHLIGLIRPLETEATQQAEQYYAETFKECNP